jgi:hypothetical protein
MKFYKDSKGVFWLDGKAIPTGEYILVVNDDLTIVSIYPYKKDSDPQLEAIYDKPIIEFIKENDTPYADWSEFYTAVSNFFVKASSTGGVTISVSDNTFPIGDAGGNLIDSELTYNPLLNRYESNKTLYAPTIVSDPSTFRLGDAYSISSSGEDIINTNLATGDKYSSIKVKHGEVDAKEQVVVGVEKTIIPQSSKSDIVINPFWENSPSVDWRIVKLTFEVDTTITNVKLKITRLGKTIYTAKLGTLNANVETTIDLTVPNNIVPIEGIFGKTYLFSLSSDDGDVRCKGTSVGEIPWFKVGFYQLKDRIIMNEDQTTFGKINQDFTSFSSQPSKFINYNGDLRNGVSQPTIAVSSSDQIIAETITNEANDVALLSMEISHNGNFDFVNMKVEATNGSFSQLVNLVDGLQTINFDETLIINASETFTITFDATNGISGDGGTTVQMSLDGIVGTPIDIYYVLKVRDLVTHTTLTTNDVPTKFVEQFSARDERFFGELGLPTDQGWTNTSTGSVQITLEHDLVNGIEQQVVYFNDTFNDGLIRVNKQLTAQDFINMRDYGFEFSATLKLRNVNGPFFMMQASAADNPIAPEKRTYRFQPSRIGEYVRIQTIIPGGGAQYSEPLDGANGLPIVRNTDYFKVEIRSSGGLGTSKIYVNGVDINLEAGFETSSSSITTSVLTTDGSTGGTDYESNVANFGATILTESPTKTLTAAAMGFETIEIITPKLARDFKIILPNGNPRKIGDEIKMIASNVGGKIILETEDINNPESLFNGLHTYSFEVDVIENISGINTVDNNNIYVGFGSVPFNIIENLNTGLISGGGLSINAIDDNKIDIEAGVGRIVDFTNPKDPLFKIINFNAQTVAGNRFGLTTVTHFTVDVNNQIVQLGTFDQQWPSADERRDYIYLGNGDHNAAQNAFVSANNPKRSAYGLNGGLIADILESVGGIVSDGNKFTSNGNNLKLDVESGTMIRYGGNFKNKNRPHTPNNEIASQASFARAYQTANGLSFVQFTDIDPNNYQPIGNTTTLEAVPSGKFTIQRLYRYGGGGPTGGGFNLVHYGNTLYQSLESARSNILIEPFLEDSSLKPASFKGWLIVKEGITDLTQAIVDGDALIMDYQGALRPPIYSVDTPLKEVDFIYAQLSDVNDQTFPAINTPHRIRFNTQDGINNLVHDTTVRPYDISINVSGSYSITAQPQVEKDGGGAGIQDFFMWLRVGDVNNGNVTGVTIASPASITTESDHGLTTGQIVYLDGFVTTPDINGEHTITVTSPTTFTIPVTTTAVTDGTGTFDRLLDSNDDVPNSNIRLAIADNFFSSVQILTATQFYKKNQKVNIMAEVTDLAVTLAADAPAGKPVIPSIIFTMNKVG